MLSEAEIEQNLVMFARGESVVPYFGPREQGVNHPYTRIIKPMLNRLTRRDDIAVKSYKPGLGSSYYAFFAYNPHKRKQDKQHDRYAGIYVYMSELAPVAAVARASMIVHTFDDGVELRGYTAHRHETLINPVEARNALEYTVIEAVQFTEYDILSKEFLSKPLPNHIRLDGHDINIGQDRRYFDAIYWVSD